MSGSEDTSPKKAVREKKEKSKPELPAADADAKETTTKSQRSEWGIWIGNLPYSITKDDIIEFLKSCKGTITRVNIPKKGGKVRGFAYVDFDSKEAVTMALAHSEQPLGGRAVLIKNASDFNKSGMPSRAVPSAAAEAPKADGKKSKRAKNPPAPSLFVGNLSFDTKKEQLKTAFRPFGELVGVRVATFEDNPEKCKGFAYIDFKYTDDATKALKSPDLRQIGSRRARIEYAGEEATRKGRPWEFDPKTANSYRMNKPGKRTANGSAEDDDPSSMENDSKRSRKLDTETMAETKLQGLPVEYEGQKITFGD
ncbi:Nucleolar protein 13 [Coemansia guatemalensis]|uniref:Nucleolar protein 13 n=1 Tax=Coemansia guatemalensis TaxID=2761395 RepID=A0A9W8LP75_9FUNG|nr:Nucleolar protein 13 [Coemansia guatemalensis]